MSRRRRGHLTPRAGRRLGLWHKLAILAAVSAVISAAAVWLVLSRADGPSGPPRAVVVDQLSLTAPNPAFVERATGLLEQAGYAVSYFSGEEVTVDFYRRLPTHGYDLILFRVHADRLQAVAEDGTRVDDVMLFTSEPYDETEYVADQEANRLVIARYYEGGPGYFGVAPDFFDGRPGDFEGATIIVMGCEGLLTDRTAEKFVQMGARTYIGWDESVTASHTDAATERLLQYLVIEGKTPQDAVALTMLDVGPDPVYGSKLLAYPPEG